MRPMGLGTGKIKTTQMAVALLFPEDVSREIDEVRERFGSARARAIVPHITVVYPFVALARTYVVIEELKPVAAMTKPFPIVLDGFSRAIALLLRERNDLLEVVDRGYGILELPPPVIPVLFRNILPYVEALVVLAV